MNETILLLASDQGIRNVIERALESAGYSVLTAVDVGAAADLLKKYKFDLLIVRPYTENVSGHDAALYLRLTSPGIPVLIVAGLLDDIDLETREALQEFEIFPKPFTAAQLVERVKELLLHPHRLNAEHRDL
jgi:DNA-binding response OmpR family regulator